MSRNKRLVLPIVIGCVASTLPVLAQFETTVIERRTTLPSVRVVEPASTVIESTTMPVGRTVVETTTLPVETTVTTPVESRTVIEKTTTVSSPATSFVFSPGHSYVVVDPLTGAIRGAYDPGTKLLNGQVLSSGMFIVDKSSNAVIATVNPAGEIVDVSVSAAAPVLISSLSTRRVELTKMITDALTRGSLTTARAAQLRARLDQVALDEAAARSSGGLFTYSEVLAIATALNAIGDEVIPVAHVTTYTPLIGGRFILSNGSYVLVDDWAYKKLSLERRVDDEYKAGRLSNRQVADLKESLNEFSATYTKYMRDGKLSSSETKTLANKMSRLETRLTKDIAYINNKRSKIGITVY